MAIWLVMETQMCRRRRWIRQGHPKARLACLGRHQFEFGTIGPSQFEGDVEAEAEAFAPAGGFGTVEPVEEALFDVR